MQAFSRYISYLSLLLLLSVPLGAQETAASVRWLSFAALEDSLVVRPKKVFISFHTDWCVYCRKMERVAFADAKVIELLNEEYYAVRFDAESERPVTFGGRTFVNDQLETSRHPLHQITQLLALRGGRFVAPTLVLLDEEFRVVERRFEYLDVDDLLALLAPASAQ